MDGREKIIGVLCVLGALLRVLCVVCVLEDPCHSEECVLLGQGKRALLRKYDIRRP